EYNAWKTKSGIYFIFLNKGLEYIGECTKGQHRLAGRMWKHSDDNPLIRRYILDQDYRVSFYEMTDTNEIKSLEKKLINCDPIPFGNLTILQRKTKEKTR